MSATISQWSKPTCMHPTHSSALLIHPTAGRWQYELLHDPGWQPPPLILHSSSKLIQHSLHSLRRRLIPTRKTHHSCWEPRIYHPDLICDFIYPFHLSVLQRTAARKKTHPGRNLCGINFGVGWRNQGSEKLQPQISSPRLTARKFSVPKTPERQRKSLFGTPQRERDSSRYVHFFALFWFKFGSIFY